MSVNSRGNVMQKKKTKSKIECKEEHWESAVTARLLKQEYDGPCIASPSATGQSRQPWGEDMLATLRLILYAPLPTAPSLEGRASSQSCLSACLSKISGYISTMSFLTFTRPPVQLPVVVAPPQEGAGMLVDHDFGTQLIEKDCKSAHYFWPPRLCHEHFIARVPTG